MKRVRSSGFTLIEVLVSMGLGMMVVLTMLSTVGLATKGYRTATRRIDTQVEARAALRILADDVATIILNEDEPVSWNSEDDRFQEIGFLTLKPFDAQDQDLAVGDVCYVHYFTAVTPDARVEGARVSRKLYRRFLSSAELVDSLEQGVLPTVAPNPDQAELVAFNVMKFVTRPLSVNSEMKELAEWSRGMAPPEVLEVELLLLDEETAGLFRLEEDWNLKSPLANRLLNEEEGQAVEVGRIFRVNLSLANEG